MDAQTDGESMNSSEIPGMHVRIYSAHHSKHDLIGTHILFVTCSGKAAAMQVTSYINALHLSLFVKLCVVSDVA
jgi:hypothetical protein